MPTQSVDLWEAWIDTQIIGSREVTILYVVGEIFADRQCKPTLIKRSMQPYPAQLHLDVAVQKISFTHTEEVYFSEVIVNECPYNEVIVFSNNQIVARMKEIETVGADYA